jgi:hypothetical protein
MSSAPEELVAPRPDAARAALALFRPHRRTVGVILLLAVIGAVAGAVEPLLYERARGERA